MPSLDQTPTAKFVRRILGAASELEKDLLVLKLRAARERTGKLGGRRPITETCPAACKQAIELAGMSSRKIASQLAAEGHLSALGKPFSSSTVLRMLNAGAAR